MFSNKDQFSTAAKIDFESQLAAITALTNKAFESVAQLVDLNVSAAKASLEHSAARCAATAVGQRPAGIFCIVRRANPAER